MNRNMDPKGKFNGDTLSIWWKAKENASSYFITVEQCHDYECKTPFKVVDYILNSTEVGSMKWEQTSSDRFGPCINYNLKVAAKDYDGRRVGFETTKLIKDPSQCSADFPLIIAGVTLSILAIIMIFLIAAIMYFCQKDPIQKFQRARSRVYSRLYAKDRYIRPYDKNTFLKELNLSDIENEFTELEQLASDTIQRRINQSKIPVNRRRNRYQDIVPFDATRVVLEKPLPKDGETEISDYINASLISDISSGGRHSTPSYIAAQGPSDETIGLFWEMAWQKNVRVIVMLTNLIEGLGFNANKCSQYWPNMVGSSRRYQDIDVQLYDRQEAPDYLVHKLDVSKKDISKEIVHVQCTSWPDRSAPKDASILLQLVEVVRVLSFQYNKTTDHQPPGPWLVHCSAGVGRTGTFIALDQLLKAVDDPSNQVIDVFNTCYLLRKERRYLVQTVTQYAYLYKCLSTYLLKKVHSE